MQKVSLNPRSGEATIERKGTKVERMLFNKPITVTLGGQVASIQFSHVGVESQRIKLDWTMTEDANFSIKQSPGWGRGLPGGPACS